MTYNMEQQIKYTIAKWKEGAWELGQVWERKHMKVFGIKTFVF